VSPNPTPDALALALLCTTKRYLQGYMVRETFRDHRRALWGRAEELGIRKQVLAVLLNGTEDFDEETLRLVREVVR
jgi:hypothetical protein